MQLFAGNKTLRWESWMGPAWSIACKGLDFLAEGVIIAPATTQPFACRYALCFDSAWYTQSLSLAVIGEARSLLLVMDAKGRWLRERSRLMPMASWRPIPVFFVV